MGQFFFPYWGRKKFPVSERGTFSFIKAEDNLLTLNLVAVSSLPIKWDYKYSKSQRSFLPQIRKKICNWLRLVIFFPNCGSYFAKSTEGRFLPLKKQILEQTIFFPKWGRKACLNFTGFTFSKCRKKIELPQIIVQFSSLNGEDILQKHRRQISFPHRKKNQKVEVGNFCP